MPNVKVLVLTGLLVAGALAVTLFDGGSQGKKDPRIGKTVVDTEALEPVDKLTIAKGETTIKLHRSDKGRWFLGEVSGFPADAEKVVRLWDELSKAKFIRVVADDKEKLGEFGLEQGTKITLMAGEKQVLDFQKGSSGSSGGFYGTVGGEYKVYLLDPSVTAAADESAWELKEIINLEADAIKAISFPAHGKDEAVTLEREKKEDALKVAGLSEKEEENTSAVSTQKNILSAIRYSKRFDVGNEEAKTAMEKTRSATITTFDGRVYTAEVGSVGKDQPKYFLRVTVTGDNLDEAAAEEVAMLNDVMKGWSFEVPAHVGKKFEKTRADFVKAKAPATGG